MRPWKSVGCCDCLSSESSSLATKGWYSFFNPRCWYCHVATAMLGWVKLISKGYSRHLWYISMPCSTCWLVAGPGKTPCRPGFGNHCRFQWELGVECKADHYWVALVAITAPGDLLGTLSWWGWWHPMQLLGLLFALLSFAAGGLERLKMAANRDRTGVLSHVHQ
jgi:hypothetical protein